jgi:hypothetical protein
MDAEEKRRKKTEYQRKRRALLKGGDEPLIAKPSILVDTDVAPLKNKPKKAKAVSLKENSIKSYTSKLRAFHKRMTDLDLSEDIEKAIRGEEYDKKVVQDEFKYLLTRVNEIKEKELKAIPNICKVFSKITGFVKLIRILVPIKRNIEMAESERRNESTISEENVISFDRQDVLANAVKLTDDYEKIMYLLMTLIPTRRLDDYRTMTYGKSEGNYYDDEHLYIRDTNTKNKKSITIKIPTEVIDILPHTGYLLGYEYSAPALSVKFSNMMTKIYGKKIGALDLRRIYLTTVNKSAPSYLERNNIANAVGHSVDEGLKYALKVVSKQEPQEAQV